MTRRRRACAPHPTESARPTAHPSAERPRRHRRPRSRRARLGRAALAVTAVTALCAGGTGWYLYQDIFRHIGTSDALDDDAPKSSGGATNILLMGLDSRKDQNGEDLPDSVLDKLHAGGSDIGGYNTNTLILLHVPAGNGKATAFSLPRDDLVDIPGFPKDKIKKAYGLTKARTEERLAQQGTTDRRTLERAGREAGRRAEIETVRRFLDVPVDHFAEISLVGFHHLADALDGVEVCLKHPVKDRYSGADFRAGRQTLDGARSLAFVRQRHGLDGGDLDRTRRQQAFLASAGHKLDSVGTFTNPARLMRLLDVVKQDVVIDKGWDLASFVQHARNLSRGDVEFSTLPIEGFAKHHGEDVNLVDPDRIRKLVRERTGGGPDRTGQPGTGRGDGPSPTRPNDGKPTPGPPARDEHVVEGGGIPCVD
ncbi:LCP family protein [Streptomyces netropsis]|uniref:LCP family protein n=1 Tax=Streptomyces netropsis TaxID=55404 RepID=UPI003798A164